MRSEVEAVAGDLAGFFTSLGVDVAGGTFVGTVAAVASGVVNFEEF